MNLDRLSKSISWVLSLVFHPLLVPIYGLLIYKFAFDFAYSMVQVTPEMWLCAVFFTLVVPVVGIYWLKLKGMVKSFTMEERQERRIPYIITMASWGVGGYIIAKEYGLTVGWFLMGAGAMIGILDLINVFWKMSAHLMAWGGLTGAVACVCLTAKINPTLEMVLGREHSGLMIGLVLISGGLGYARIDLGAHSFMQTLWGFLLGFLGLFFILLFGIFL